MRSKPPRFRHQINPERDAELTRQFHLMMDNLREPTRPADGVRLKHPINWPGWLTVRVDVRLLK